ncbi:MAG: hypothetical protein LBQ56_02285 [Synergistaceae bacterium]|jgi:hypothetical protein|nr:hypothetical protein [Synergistaceae bacterium]
MNRPPTAPSAARASENFYRNVFALLTFAAFACALATDSIAAFASALVLGALSRTAVKKNWKNPRLAKYVPFLVRAKKSPDEE